MGCICSKGSSIDEYVDSNMRREKEEGLNKHSVQLVAPSTGEEFVSGPGGRGGGGFGETAGSVHPISKSALQGNVASAPVHGFEGDKKSVTVGRSTKTSRQRRITLDMENSFRQRSPVSSIPSMPNGVKGEQLVAGWPSWLSSVAAEAIQGWVPLRAESYEKLDKIGQGTYSTVYKARDLDGDRIVALKKVRFGNMDPESVRFMAREILVLRRLDHPNVMKLEGLIISKTSGNLYLVFEYMEHDLAGLSATPGVKFTEPQIKCYMQQLLRGLEHCHSQGVLHRDIKGSNLLIDNNGLLKIGDFGLASLYSDPSQPLTSRVVTLWYRPLELLLGATKYGASVDLWSTGCIIAEMFAGNPIMPGSTEVEQIHKIFKLCGSPSEEYWRKSKLPHASSFKPQHRYKCCLAETFRNFPPSALALVEELLSLEPEARGTASSALKSEFFRTKPLPSDPSSLPKYAPSKEYDARLRNEEARRKRAEAIKGRGAESVRRGSRQCKDVPTPEFKHQEQASLRGQTNGKCISEKQKPGEDRGTALKDLSYSTPMINQNAVRSKTKLVGDEIHLGHGQGHTVDSSRHNAVLGTHEYHMPRVVADMSAATHRMDRRITVKESGYVPRVNRMHYSGPLMSGGNMEEMLREHEKQIQEAVRKSRISKTQDIL